MANFAYWEHDQDSLVNRFSFSNFLRDDIRGLSTWIRYMNFLERFLISDSGREREEISIIILREMQARYSAELSGTDAPPLVLLVEKIDEYILILLLDQLRNFPALPHRCPRVFLSHRQCDWLYALNMAKLANNNKFEYWLDIHDPVLNWLNTYSGKSVLRTITIACIIEMALINCTHVLACMTPNSRGTLWQPYEYGRITDVPGYFQKAATWPHPGLSASDFPGYMYLGEITHNKTAIEQWMQQEYKRWALQNCQPQKNALSESLQLPELPEPQSPGFQTGNYPYTAEIAFEYDEPQLFLIKNSSQEVDLLRYLNEICQGNEGKSIKSLEVINGKSYYEAKKGLDEPLELPGIQLKVNRPGH